MKAANEKDLAGCCGIYCGLCPRFQSEAPSRCPGCRILSQTISCKRYNCCVKNKGLSTCAECGDFPCDRYDSFLDWDSFVSHRICLPNIARIIEMGLAKWLREQSARRALLEKLLAEYNEGRSMSFFCIAAALMPPALIDRAVKEANGQIGGAQVDDADIQTRAKRVRATILEHARAAGVELRLRHGR